MPLLIVIEIMLKTDFIVSSSWVLGWLFLSFQMQIKVDDNGKIVDAKFKTFGCGSAIASSSLATEWIKGKNVRSCNLKLTSNKGTVFKDARRN